MTNYSPKADARTLRIIGAFNDVLNGLDILIGEAHSGLQDLFLDNSHSDIAETIVESMNIDLLEIHDKLEICRALIVSTKAVNYENLLKQLQNIEQPSNENYVEK